MCERLVMQAMTLHEIDEYSSCVAYNFSNVVPPNTFIIQKSCHVVRFRHFYSELVRRRRVVGLIPSLFQNAKDYVLFPISSYKIYILQHNTTTYKLHTKYNIVPHNSIGNERIKKKLYDKPNN